MDCIYCKLELPPVGFFCPTCFKQNKCKSCNEILVADAKICVFCGEQLNQSSNNINTIEFSETESERKFKASFTDTVGQSISDSFGILITNRFGSKKISLPVSSEFQNPKHSEEGEVEVLNNLEENNEIKTGAKTELFQIPTLQDVKLRDLAKSETDWLLVYMFTASVGGTKEFSREDIIQLYKDTDRRNDNRIKSLSQLFKNISKSLYIKSTNDNKFILLPKGKEKALEIFKGNSSSKVVNAKKAKSSKNNEGSNKPKAKAIEVKFLNDLNLRPKGRESLKEFAAKYQVKTSEELSLLIVYYLKEILGETVTLSHVFTCLKELGKKVPTHLKQVLINNKNNKNWIDPTEWDDIKFTIAGMNHMEHDLTKI